MQVTEKRNFMDFSSKLFKPFTIFIARAGNIFYDSRDSWLPFTLYIAEILYISGALLKNVV